MKRHGMIGLLGILSLLGVGYAGQGSAQESREAAREKVTAFERGLAADATHFLEVQIKEPINKRIPESMRRQAKCIAVFPRVGKAGVVIAGTRGYGLASCRDKQSGEWGAPAFINITAGSIGLQAGGKESSYIFLFMNSKAVEGLLNEKVAFGSDMSVAGGPLGGAGADINKLPAVVTYVRSEGFFVGADVKAFKLTFATTSNEKFYDWDDAKEILFEKKQVPERLRVFHETLIRFAPRGLREGT